MGQQTTAQAPSVKLQGWFPGFAIETVLLVSILARTGQTIGGWFSYRFPLTNFHEAAFHLEATELRPLCSATTWGKVL